jgi:zinc/manganese transport system substrate-binding protein
VLRRSVASALALTLATALALVGCAQSSTALEPGATSAAQAKIAVVASTNVWGSIAQEIGGSRVSVVSFIDDPNKDPHEYAASPRNQLELSRAQVVIENGGGYDDFMDTVLSNAANPKLTVLNAVDLTGHANDDPLNEHVWYDLDGVLAVGQKLADTFTTIDAEHSKDFERNLELFTLTLQTLSVEEKYNRGLYHGVGVAITEPVPLYLLDSLGLVNETPQGFSKAIEDGTDAPPAVLKATIDLFDSHRVSLLVYNEQTTGAETEAVLAAANKNGIPVVSVRETLPAGEDYLSWMTDNLNRIGKALAK